MIKHHANQIFPEILGAMLPFGGFVTAFYQVYFDESGTHKGSKLMTMAGYVFEARQARLFARDWQKDLQRIGLTHAHMTDCANGNGEYKNLTMRQRINSEELLIKRIKKRSVLGMSISMNENYFNEIMDGVPFTHSAYTFLLLLSVNKISDYIKRVNPDGKIAYFFESGHAKSKEAHLFMNAIRHFGWEDYFSYVGHSFLDKKLALPLQAADMLAWQHRHYLIRSMEGHTEPRKDFKALIREQDLQSHVERRHIVDMAMMLKNCKDVSTQNSLAFLSAFRDMFTCP